MRAAALLLLTIMVSRAAAGGGGSAPMVPLLRLSGGGEATSGEGMNFEGIKAALDDAPGQRSGIKSGERKRRFMEGLPDSPPDDDGAIAELGAGMKAMEEEFDETFRKEFGIDFSAIPAEKLDEISDSELFFEDEERVFTPGGKGDWSRPGKLSLTEEEFKAVFMGRSLREVTAEGLCPGGAGASSTGAPKERGIDDAAPLPVAASPLGTSKEPIVEGKVVGHVAAICDTVTEFVGTVEEAQEDGEVDGKLRESAARFLEACGDESMHLNLDLRRLAKQIGEDAEPTVRSIAADAGYVPPEAPESYKMMRYMHGMHRKMGIEGGAHFVNPLLYGHDPFFDRCDFRMEETAEGAISARYVGDCAVGGYRPKREY